MNSEQEGSESKLLTGSTPTTATTSPVKANKLTDTEVEIEAIAAAVQPDPAIMGDVLTKEHKNDSTSELCSDLPQADDDQPEENENTESQNIVVQEQPEPPPPPSPSAEEPTELIACDVSPTLESTSLPDVPEEDFEIKESVLSELLMFNNQEVNNDSEENICLQNKENLHAVSTTTEDLCSCEDSKLNTRDLSTEDLQEMMKLRRLGMDLRKHIRFSFNWFMESNYELQPGDLDAIKNFVKLRESVALLWDRVPYHLFMWMVGQAQEFVIGVKVQLFTILYDPNIDNLAEVFLTKLLHGYEALLSTALHTAELLKPLQKELFSKVNMTWGYINKSLYQNYVYSDPLIQNNLPPFIGQLKKRLPMKGSQCYYLVQSYLVFDSEITKIGSLCPEIERIIDKYNAEQVTGSVMKKLREDFERFQTRLKLNQPNSNLDLNNKSESEQEVDHSSGTVQNEEVLEIQSMFNDWKKSPQQRLAELVEALTASKTVLEEEQKSKISKEKKCFPSCLDCLEKTVKEDINDASELQTHVCLPDNDVTQPPLGQYKFENSETIINKIMNICVTDFKNPKEPVVEESNESNECPPFSPYVLSKQNTESPKEPVKKVSKTTTAQTAQTQTRHSTTQTPSATHNQSHMHRHHRQGRCSSHSHLHGSLSYGVIKTSGPHRTHVGHNNHPSAAVTCHKQQHIVEHIKRLSTSDLSPGENGDCSDSGSSHEDSCSATNSPTPRDSSRHCDCCYCEVFGHGVPSVAPVSRNYKEMRERLRQLLTRKKAKVCKAACNPHTKSSVEVSLSSSSLSSSSSTSSTVTNADTIALPNPAARSNTPTATNSNTVPITANKVVNNTKVPAPLNAIKDKKYWNIEELVEFIEGNQSGKKDKKKAEKKARQKQKKLEEKLKKEKEEENQLKLIELQKKTPEVTITVVNPQKQGSQRPVTQPKLPEVSILPTISMPESTSSKQANTVKKKNGEIINNNVKNANKNKLSPSTTPVDNVKKKTASVDKINEVININNAKSKSPGKATEPISQVAVNDNSNNLSNLTKKERKKLKREMEKQEALKKELESKQVSSSTDSQLQIVTIKRIMESNNAEPTVTITLKGQTPAEDRVLFTLVNGQTKDSPGEKQSQNTSKKKKNKGNSSNNQSQQVQTANKTQHNNNNAKSETVQKQDKILKQQQQQQTNKDKGKATKQQEEKLRQQQHSTITETNAIKSKKDKKKNNENKENIMKSVLNDNSQKQENNISNKKSNKTSITQAAKQQLSNLHQKQQPHQQQLQQQPSAHSSNNNNKNTKGVKNQSLNQNQNQNQKLKNNTNQTNSGKVGKSIATNNSNQSVNQPKIDNQKFSKLTQNTSNKQKPNEAVQNQKKEQVDSLQNHYRETHNSSSINIENLKLPPGITITKVDAPVKPLPIKSNIAPKPANNSPKQTTIIAAPMSGVQSSAYGNSQNTGNVIVVDTGRLKQDLVPKSTDKDGSKDQLISKKKKKKKNKNSTTLNANEKANSGLNSMPGNKQQQQNHSNDYMNVEPARILHNPSTNMVTIRNPAFGPPPPKMEPSIQQAAIIKVAENGMVTIRSPALQQAINAGLQPPPKPDFIVKGSSNSNDSHKPSNNSFMNGSELSGAVKGSNGMQLSTDLAELRRRLAHQPDNERMTSSSTLFNNGLSSIQISKVTNGQSPHIPENGINLKGTSVTLTKIRSVDPHPHSQQLPHFDEPKANTLNGSVSAKSRKKKKRGNGVRQNGDDWNLVESVFTPKDIDLEDGEMDDAERELEAFKRFCLQSVPPPRKEKVNLNLKDIVLKKKSSSSGSLTATAAATAAAVVATI